MALNREKKHRHSVGRTFTAGIMGVLILGMGTSMYLVYRVQRNFFLERVGRETEETSAVVKQSLESAMILHQPGRIQETVTKISQIQAIKTIMFISEEAQVKWSGDTGQIGKTLSIRDPSCWICHKEPPSKRPKSVELRVHGAHIYRTMNPLYNKKVCQRCHRSGNSINGVLLLDTYMDDTDRIIAAVARKIFHVSLAIMAIICGMIFLFTRWFVQKPVMKLVDGARRIGEGDLSMTIDAGMGNEFGELAEAFNRMSADLADYVKQLEEKTRLEAYSRFLEDKVAERTEELEKADRALRRVNEELLQSGEKLETSHRRLMETQSQLFLSGKLAALGELAGGVAHELNNPLAGILTFIEALYEKANTEGLEASFAADCREIFPNIRRELVRCGRIIENLLAFARYKFPGAADMNLNTIILEVIAVLEGQPGFRNIEIRREMAEDLQNIKSNRDYAAQIVMNVMVNASQAIQGPGTITIRTGNRGEENIFLSVADTGCGIPADALPKIFDPFFTTKEGGTGLGLSVTHGIIEKLGGKIEIETQENIGTTISFVLPVNPPAHSESEKNITGNSP